MHRFPFNWQNPLGYLIALTLIFISHLIFLRFIMCCLSFGIGVFVIVTSLTMDIKNDLIAFNDRTKTEPNPILLSKSLIQFVQIHSTALRCDKKICSEPSSNNFDSDFTAFITFSLHSIADVFVK